MGTSLREILKNHPDYIRKNGGINYPEIARTIHRVIKADAAKSGSSVSYKKTNLRPLENDQRDIVDFRVYNPKELAIGTPLEGVETHLKT